MPPSAEPPIELQSPGPSTSYRPLVVVLTAAVAGSAVDRWLSFGLWYCLGLAGAGLILWLTCWHRHRERLAMVGLLWAIVFCAASWHHCCWSLFSVDELGRYATDDSLPVCITAVALDFPEAMPEHPPDPLYPLPQQSRHRLELEVTGLRAGRFWLPASGRTTLSVTGTADKQIVAGKTYLIFGQIRRIIGPQNPGEFDYASYARADRLLCQMRTAAWECVEPLRIAKPSTGVLDRWTTNAHDILSCVRAGGSRLLERHLSRAQSRLAGAVLLGARGELADERIEAFVQTGTVHLLAISGLHIGLVAGGLGLALRWMMVPRTIVAFAAAIAAVLYAMLTEARPPAIRAAALVAAGSLAYCLGRRPISANLLAAAGLVVLAINPAEVFRTGTQLSFLAVASLVWLRPWRWLRVGYEELPAESRPRSSWAKALAHRVWIDVGSLFLVGMVIWAVALPLIAARFHLIAPIALPLNVLLWPMMSLAMVSGLGVLATGWFWPAAASWFGWACDGWLGLLETSVVYARDLPMSHFWVPGPADWWLAGFYGALAAMAWFSMLRLPRRWAIGLLAGWVAVGFSASTMLHRSDELQCTFLSVGHGCAAVVRLPSGKTLLYDCGALGSPERVARTVSSALWDAGVTHLDAVVLSHSDIDHFNALPELIRQFSVGVVYVSPLMFELDSPAVGALHSAIQSRGIRLAEVRLGDRLDEDDCTIEVLHPPQRGVLGGDNANSVVLRIEATGRSLLLPGDLDSPGLDDLVAEIPRHCDLLLAPHHGSPSSKPSTLAAWCWPTHVVISGGNHANWERAAAIYRQAGAEVWHTGSAGAIRARFGEDGLLVENIGRKAAW